MYLQQDTDSLQHQWLQLVRVLMLQAEVERRVCRTAWAAAGRLRRVALQTHLKSMTEQTEMI